MSYLKEEIRYLTDFLSSYRKKINALNKSGLLDEAKLFESFAIEVCGLYFPGKAFSNLNDAKPNFPYFDLISDDEEIYVQVSTQTDCSKKIKDTLDNIANGELLRNDKTKRLLFFLLESCDTKTIRSRKVKGIKFTKTKDIVSVDSIIKRMTSDPSFCHSLYDLIREREERVGFNDAKFSRAIRSSATIVKKRIPDTINGVSHIDRSDLIKTIQNCGRTHVLVVGDAGSGKSALIRDLLESEEAYLYVRGEDLTKGKKYSDIWDFDIELVGSYLAEKRINVFIDSLEYVVGCELSVDLLTILLSLESSVSNIKFYMTCRSNDLNVLQHYLKTFGIAQIHVDLLSDDQVTQVLDECPSLKGLPDGAKELLCIPFYADFLARHIDSCANITDESDLRKEIFETAICLKGKCESFGIDFHDVVKTVISIAKERSRQQTLYVKKVGFNSKIIRALLSSDVLLESGDGIRFSFDIFEDVIFEKILDDLHQEYSSDYSGFFSNLDSLGDSCYRRYNLWISNKLKSDDSHSLIMEILRSGSNLKWIEQTMISIALSDNSGLFLNQYLKLIGNAEKEELIKLINVSAFNVDYDKDTFDAVPFLSLIPVGLARIVMINHLFDEYGKGNFDLNGDHIITLLLDGERSSKADGDTKKRIVFLTEKILELHLSLDVWDDKDSDLITLLLKRCELSVGWLKSFLITIGNDEYKDNVFREGLVNDLFAFHFERVAFKGELNGLMSEFFFNKITESSGDDRFILRGPKYGLNELSDRVDLTRTKPFTSSCFSQIISGNFLEGLKLYIRLTNHIADKIKSDCGVIHLNDIVENREYKYVYCEDLYFAGWFDGCNLPYLIQDIAFVVIGEIKALFNALKDDQTENICKVASNLKSLVLQESNNVGPLSLLVLIWHSAIGSCPNYANELITDHTLITLDLSRQARLFPNRKSDYLKDALAQSFGLPGYDKRFEFKEKPFTLRDIFFRSQIMRPNADVIDFCYQKYADDEKALSIYRPLDIRKAKISAIDEGIMIEGYGGETERKESPYETANRLVGETLTKMHGRMDCVQEAEDVCAFLSGLDSSIAALFDEEILFFYSYLLANPSISEKRREEICTIVIQKHEDVLHAGQVPAFKHDHFLILFKQVDFLKNQDVIYRIGRLTISFLLGSPDNVFIRNVQKSLEKFFEQNEIHRSHFCNAMIELAKQEREKQLYNLAIAKKIYKNEDLDGYYSIPDELVVMAGYKPYKDQTDLIIKRCLSGQETNYDSDVQKYDIHTLISSLLLFDFKKDFFRSLFKSVVYSLLDCRDKDRYPELFGFNESYSLQEKCSELIKDECYQDYVIDLLFDYLSSHGGKKKSLKWISRVLVAFVPSFFDEKEDRSKYFRYLIQIEDKINNLTVEEWMKNELRVVFVFNHEESFFGDWSKFDVSYSDCDIAQMNYYFTKYSHLHPQLFFASLYRLHYEKMLPKLIVPIEQCLTKASDSRRVLNDKNCHFIIRTIVFIAYAKHLIIIKQDKRLRKAFEFILTQLYENNDAVALPLLNNLRFF